VRSKIDSGWPLGSINYQSANGSGGLARRHGVDRPWPAQERLGAGVSPQPGSLLLITTGATWGSGWAGQGGLRRAYRNTIHIPMATELVQICDHAAHASLDSDSRLRGAIVLCAIGASRRAHALL
jgi:hypothetical protein